MQLQGAGSEQGTHNSHSLKRSRCFTRIAPIKTLSLPRNFSAIGRQFEQVIMRFITDCGRGFHSRRYVRESCVYVIKIVLQMLHSFASQFLMLQRFIFGLVARYNYLMLHEFIKLHDLKLHALFLCTLCNITAGVTFTRYVKLHLPIKFRFVMLHRAL